MTKRVTINKEDITNKWVSISKFKADGTPKFILSNDAYKCATVKITANNDPHITVLSCGGMTFVLPESFAGGEVEVSVISNDVINRKDKTFIGYNAEKEGYEPIRYYTREDILKVRDLIDQAYEMWCDLAEEYQERTGERSGCVLGDEIVVNYLPKGCRIVKRGILVQTPPVQCGVTKEATAKTVVKFLKANGIDCWQHFGRLD